MQFDRTVGTVRVVNAGSVGMPFGEPGAYWLLLGPDVQLRRTAYDLAKAAGRVRATTYPQPEEFARSILQPPAEADMLAMFGRRAKFEMRAASWSAARGAGARRHARGVRDPRAAQVRPLGLAAFLIVLTG